MVARKASETLMTEYREPEVATSAVSGEILNKLMLALNQFCELNHTMHVPTAMVFMQVAMQPGIGKPSIQRRLRLSTSACSRHIRMLTREGVSGTGNCGFGLVWTESDPEDARQKRVWLTPEGVSLAQSLYDYLRF
jgi:DNA-binding MarR family transcriptional regulator